MKNVEEIKNFFINQIGQKELISKKHRMISAILNYTERFLILVYMITGCVLISVFASLVSFPIGITSSAIGLKVCAMTAGIKKRKSIIRKKKKHDKTDDLTDSYISRDEFVLVNNVLKNYDEMKEEIPGFLKLLIYSPPFQHLFLIKLQ